MQRYRVNYGLLVGLLTGLVVIGAGGYFILSYQLDRNATQLLRRADTAEEEGEIREAASLLFRYYKLRPDEAEPAVRMANAYRDILKLPDAEGKDFSRAIGLMEAVVRRHGDSSAELRKSLAQLYILPGANRWVDAIKHVDALLNVDPKDQELQSMRLYCLRKSQQERKALDYASKLVGFDVKRGEFDAEAAISPDAIEVYPQLAALVRSVEKNEEYVDEVIDQMVSANPESSRALVLRSSHLFSNNREEDAEADLAKALEMAPDDAQVLLVNANRKRVEKDYDAARELLLKCREEHPDNAQVYRQLAELEISEGNGLEPATKHLEEGLEKVPPAPGRTLLFYRARLQADAADKEGLQASIKELRELGRLASFQLDFLEGRLLFIQRNWIQASRKFQKVRTLVSTNTRLASLTNYFLGACYEQLGQPDEARQAYETALELWPENPQAASRLPIVEGILNPNRNGSNDFSVLVAAELDKPANEQDWAAIDDATEAYVEERKLRPFMLPILRADTAIKRENFDEARKIVDQAKVDFPGVLAIDRVDILLIQRDKDQGPVAALKKLDALIAERYAKSVGMRLLKADLFIAIGDEAVSDQLNELAAGVDDWETSQKVQLLKGLASKFLQIRDNESRLRCLEQVAQIAPGELSTLVDLFQSALATRDQEAMRKAQKQILAVVGSEEDPTWLMTEASRLVAEAVGADRNPELLARANDLVDRAIGKREKWHLLYLVRADIAYARGDLAASLAAFDQASSLGRVPPAATRRHVALLTQAGRYSDARRVVEQASTGVRERYLGRQYAEILLNDGDITKATENAQKIAENGQQNAGVQLWYGRLLRRVAVSVKATDTQKESALENAAAAFETTVSIAPESAEAWLDLILLNLARDDRDVARAGAESALRRAQLALPADQATAVIARGYELIGRFFDADNYYKTLMTRDPNNLGIQRQAATFYLSARYQRGDGRLKATRLINKVLAAADTPEDYVTSRQTLASIANHAQWARRAAAEQLSRSKDYQKLLDAERLLLANVTDKGLPRVDRMLMAQILAPRPEPASRLRAIELLEDIRQTQRLTPQAGLILGQLYFRTGDWNSCRTQMTSTIAAAPDQPGIREEYIKMLLQNDDPQSLDEAARQLKRLQELAPTAPSTLAMIARVYSKSGRKQDAVKVLRPLLSSSAKAQTYSSIAGLFAELGAVDQADFVYSRLAKTSPQAKLQYAFFLGKYTDADRAFELLDELRNEISIPRIATTAVGIATARRDELGDALDARVQTWLDRGLRDDPESTSLLLTQAQFLDQKREYEQAIKVYRQLLEQEELGRGRRAIVLNNLAYVLSLTTNAAETPEQAMAYVAEAIDILGPSADLLDTRAVVFIAQEKPAEALADLNLALTDNPTAAKYFHKCQAHMLADELNKAVSAWDKAIGLGLSREQVAIAEREKFDELDTKIKKIRVRR